MPSNSKHIFFVSNTKSTGKSYTTSVEYKMYSTDNSASIGLVLGASKSGDSIDLTTAYKMFVYKNQDLLRFSACNGATPDAVGSDKVSLDKNVKNAGVTYKNDSWNTLSITVTKDGKLICTVNGVEVYSAVAMDYIDGYIGLYAYLPGSQFRNFKVEDFEDNDDNTDTNNEFDEFDFAYGLRADATNTYFEYDATTDGYEIKMPSNSKHIFFVSDTKSTGKSYTTSVEYKMSSTDNSASIGLVLGAGRSDNKIDLTTAYKMQIIRIRIN